MRFGRPPSRALRRPHAPQRWRNVRFGRPDSCTTPAACPPEAARPVHSLVVPALGAGLVALERLPQVEHNVVVLQGARPSAATRDNTSPSVSGISRTPRRRASAAGAPPPTRRAARRAAGKGRGVGLRGRAHLPVVLVLCLWQRHVEPVVQEDHGHARREKVALRAPRQLVLRGARGGAKQQQRRGALRCISWCGRAQTHGVRARLPPPLRP